MLIVSPALGRPDALTVAVAATAGTLVLIVPATKPSAADDNRPVVVEIVPAPADVESLRKMLVAVLVNTPVPLKVVFDPIRSISALIAVNSASSAVLWVFETVPVADSVASVMARFNRVVTCAREPSATCRLPTPSFAFRADCVRAVMLARNPSAIARPAASSAPLLMREPDDIRNSVLCKFDPVIASWFWAAREGMLFRMLKAIVNRSFGWFRLLRNRLPPLRLRPFPWLITEPNCVQPGNRLRKNPL